MKRFAVIFIVTALTTVTAHKAVSQEWHWLWGDKPGTTMGEGDLGVTIRGFDFHNNIYGSFLYNKTIYVHDTVFYHGDVNGNYVFVRYDSTGKFDLPLDVWATWPEAVYNPFLGTDHDLNLYVGGSFVRGFHIQDTTFTFAPGTSIFHPEVFIAKLRFDYDVVWGGMISGSWQDDLTGLVVDRNDDIYLASHHIASPTWNSVVVFLGQDTTHVSAPFSAITKIDGDGNIIWKREIHGYIHQLQLTMGQDGLIYYRGYSGDDLSIPGYGIITYPWVNEMWANFIIAFDADGELVQAKYLNPKTRFFHFAVDKWSNKYISWGFQDTLLLGNDTIIAPPEETWQYIAKFDPEMEQPFWYQIVPREQGQTIYSLLPLPYEDHLIFTTCGDKNVTIGDTVLQLGNYYTKGIIGEFSETGQLVNIQTVSTQYNLCLYSSMLDNCGNLVAGGKFQGTAVFNQDTLISYYNPNKEPFVAKLQIHEPLDLNLGNDTTVCEEYVLYAPSGYETYIWNDSSTGQNWLDITETGNYVLQCATEEGCWGTDSVFITVHPGIDVTLPGDTTICLYDSILIAVEDGYASYLWSTGDTTSTISLAGTDLGAGEHRISLEVTDGPCIFMDSTAVTVHPEIEVSLPEDTTIRVYDTITFAVADTFEFYHWSTGDTTCFTTIIGRELGVGYHWITLEITDGPCFFADSVYLHVQSDYAVDEVGSGRFSVFPNPGTQRIKLETPVPVGMAEIFDIHGNVVRRHTFTKNQANDYWLDISTLKRGVYLIRVYSPSGIMTGKLVKN